MRALQELSDAAALLSEGSLVGPLDRQRRLRWAERLQVTQSSLPTQVSTCPVRPGLELPGCSVIPSKSLQCYRAAQGSVQPIPALEFCSVTTLPATPGYAGTQLPPVRNSRH